MPRPALLVVHGAWHRPEHFGLLVEELSDFDVHTVALTSSGTDPGTLGDMYTDAAVIAAAAAAIDGPVAVLAHSYGGIPTTQGLRYATNVRHIVYLASFQLQAGQSLLSTNGGRLMPWVARRDGHVQAETPLHTFYNDVDPVIARKAMAWLGYQSYASMHQELTATAWQVIPSTYIVCEADNAIPVARQEVFARNADAVKRLPTSHSPFLSRPAALAKLIAESLT
ncbi:alpha/beta hydrolase [Mycolicibacterium goodii]|uniref:alpha/beta hydrolase n=1 Tax=Mycolicibacterium goodii TaxID=134601 RepID=UPI000C25DF4C|nr:alpha/beta hydrolase [Mycolicibacterium goodii]PJK22027.1 alpha/beta hydrolase [Mycolicibacterium goodii]